MHTKENLNEQYSTEISHFTKARKCRRFKVENEDNTGL